MTFEEAVKLVVANPAGPDAVAVTRPGAMQFMFAAAPLLYDGRHALMGGWVAHGRNSETHSFVFYAEDVAATDWEAIDL